MRRLPFLLKLRGSLVAASGNSDVEIVHVLEAKNTFVLSMPEELASNKRFVSFLLQEIGDEHAQTLLQSGKALPASNIGSLLLFPLQTVGDGNCLLHAASLCLFGIHDRARLLRDAVATTIAQPKTQQQFRARWQQDLVRLESLIPPEFCVRRDWDVEWSEVVRLPTLTAEDVQADGRRVGIFGSSLLSIHVYALAQVLRRPVIVYGDERASGTDERFAGIYLPSLLPPGHCLRTPIAIGSIPGHFVGLVPIHGRTHGYPLLDGRSQPLSVRFEGQALVTQRQLLSRWMDITDSDDGYRARCDLDPKTTLPESVQLMNAYVYEAAARFAEQPPA